MIFRSRIRINRPKLICILLFISPCIDIFTGFCKLNGLSIDWLSIFFKTVIFFVCFGIYINYSNAEKLVKICLILGWIGLSFIWHMHGQSDVSLVIGDLSQYIKLFLPFVLYFAILSLGRKKKLKKEDVTNVISFYLYFYPISIILPKIWGIGFSTYKSSGSGYKGFYYGGNNINILMIILTFLSVYKILYESKTLKNYIQVGLNVLGTILIGTKSSIIAMIYIFFLILFFSNEKNEKRKRGFWIVLLVGLVIVLSVFVKTNGDFVTNIIERLQWELKRVNGNFIDFITNSRISSGFPYLKMALQNDNVWLNCIFGVGYTQFVEVVEMDFLDVFLHYGILVVIGVLFFYFNIMQEMKTLFMKAVIFFVLLYAFWAGHLLISPMGSMVLMLVCVERKFAEYSLVSKVKEE